MSVVVTITIPAGGISVTVPVSTFDDSIVEMDETFLVLLSNPTGGLRVDPDEMADVTIVDDDGWLLLSSSMVPWHWKLICILLLFLSHPL